MTAPADQRSIAELETIWKSLGIDVQALQPDSDGTILPTTAAPEAEEAPLSLSLPVLAVAGVVDGPTGTPELRMGKTLGEGGMGVVKLATQVPLDREVAVKLLRAPRGEDGRARNLRALVREARITGALEHPNIIPVHALGCDARGVPMLVMKRIQGEAWRSLLRDPSHPAWAAVSHHGDRLDLHLDVLMQVCNAVHFAHSRGILHRDLKPENVMIGAFGEVYVVDWGAAAALRPDPAGLLPLARDVRNIVGTPPYMAPEQATADSQRISERTDVYLLGAILHECLTGQPRHGTSSMLSTLLRAYVSAPASYPPSVPAELAEICNRACHVDPEQRFPSAEALRDALAGFRRHRGSSALADQALRRLEGLERLLDGEDASQHDEAHRLFTEARFGLQQALADWPDNPAARQGLAHALALMARHEIERGDLQAASALLAEMAEVPETLRLAYEALEARLQAERAQLERLRQLEREMDPRVGMRTRSLLALAVASVFGVLPLVAGLGQRLGWWIVGMKGLAIQFAAFVGTMVLINLHWRIKRVMDATDVNRRVRDTLRVFLCAMAALPVGATFLRLAPEDVIAVLMLLASLAVGVMALLVEARLIWGFVIYLLGFLVAARWPGAAFEILAVANLGALLQMSLVWRPSRRAR